MLKNFILRFAPYSLLWFFKRYHYIRALKNFNEVQEKDIAIVKKLTGKGDYVVDIGANVGWYTKILAEQVGGTGRVFSIEPIPPTFKLLQHTVKVFRLANVRLYPVGLSDKEGVVAMEVPAYQQGGTNFYMARIVDAGMVRSSHTGETFDVSVTTLDTLLSEFHDRIAFIKCDVEGHEWPVIQGAAALTHKSQPAWMIEISGDVDDVQSSSGRLADHFLRQGYGMYWYDGEKLVKREPGHVDINYFFLLPKHVQMLLSSKVSVID